VLGRYPGSLTIECREPQSVDLAVGGVDRPCGTLRHYQIGAPERVAQRNHPIDRVGRGIDPHESRGRATLALHDQPGDPIDQDGEVAVPAELDGGDDLVRRGIDADERRCILAARRPDRLRAEREAAARAGVARDLDRRHDLVGRGIDPIDAGRVGHSDPDAAEPQADLMWTTRADVAGTDRRDDLVRVLVDPCDGATAVVGHPDGTVLGVDSETLGIGSSRDLGDDLERGGVNSEDEVGIEIVQPEAALIYCEATVLVRRIDSRQGADRIRGRIDSSDLAGPGEDPEKCAVGREPTHIRCRDCRLGCDRWRDRLRWHDGRDDRRRRRGDNRRTDRRCDRGGLGGLGARSRGRSTSRQHQGRGRDRDQRPARSRLAGIPRSVARKQEAGHSRHGHEHSNNAVPICLTSTGHALGA